MERPRFRGRMMPVANDEVASESILTDIFAKERMTNEESSDVRNRIAYSDNIDSLKTADFVIGAANEDFNIKNTKANLLAMNDKQLETNQNND